MTGFFAFLNTIKSSFGSLLSSHHIILIHDQQCKDADERLPSGVTFMSSTGTSFYKDLPHLIFRHKLRSIIQNWSCCVYYPKKLAGIALWYFVMWALYVFVTRRCKRFAASCPHRIRADTTNELHECQQARTEKTVMMQVLWTVIVPVCMRHCSSKYAKIPAFGLSNTSRTAALSLNTIIEWSIPSASYSAFCAVHKLKPRRQ